METNNEIDDYKKAYQTEFLEKQGYKSILRQLYSQMPDMCWIKDVQGRYVWGNGKLIHGLLCQSALSDVEGRTDLEIASGVKAGTSAEHTVGITCTGSDLTTIRKAKQGLFYEEFYINGEYTVLEVIKDVIKDGNGDITGTVGVGRDMTELFTIINEDSESALENAQAYLNKHLIKDEMYG